MIRRATANDLDGINRLLRQVLTVHADGRPDLFVHNTKKYSDTELLALFTDDIHPVFVYVDADGQVLGHAFCMLQEIKNVATQKDRRMLYIDDICVDEACRHRHIASELYAFVREYARSIGCYHITLNVWQSNPGAKAFYEKMGMQPLKTVMEDIL